jgi:error-prone DNA polymerase
MGLRYVRGLRAERGLAIERAREERAFASIDDLARRAKLRSSELATLAELGALAHIAHPTEGAQWTRRSALWQALAVARAGGGPLLDRVDLPPGESPLAEMTRPERVAADLALGSLTVGAHPVALARATLRAEGISSVMEAMTLANHRSVSVAGAVITRQKPPTAKGYFFLTIEDETGILNAIVPPGIFEAQRATMVTEPLLVLHGVVQREDNVFSVRVAAVAPFTIREGLAHGPSHDFR